jgi:hypothetical protein
MDGNPTSDRRGLQVKRGFEQNRLAGQFLGEAYEHVVPVHRRVISIGGGRVWGDREDDRGSRREGSCRLEVGGCR